MKAAADEQVRDEEEFYELVEEEEEIMDEMYMEYVWQQWRERLTACTKDDAKRDDKLDNNNSV